MAQSAPQFLAVFGRGICEPFSAEPTLRLWKRLNERICVILTRFVASQHACTNARASVRFAFASCNDESSAE
jgi:hypothetical protein